MEAEGYYDVAMAPAQGTGIMVQHHRPKVMTSPYHFHASIEVNLLTGCRMTYAFAGREVTIPEGRAALFWAAHPHRVIAVEGEGTITVAYLPLPDFLSWRLGPEMTRPVLGGAVLTARRPGGNAAIRAWADESGRADPAWRRLHAAELHARLARMALEGFDVILSPASEGGQEPHGARSAARVERMLAHLARHHSEPVRVDDVADAAGLPRNRAMSLFRRMTGQTILTHLSGLRVDHARMLLRHTNRSVSAIAFDTGFGSLSRFYAVFGEATGLTPSVYRARSGRQKL